MSILEYLASLRKFGHAPHHIGTVTIGRTVYAAGTWFNYANVATMNGTKGEERIVLMPIYRTDWERQRNSRKPDLLPASYRRSRKTVFRDDHGKHWSITGWNANDGVLWMAPHSFDHSPTMAMHERWTETFRDALALAGPEVLARVEAAE